MNVILYMAISANGLIAGKDDDTSFVSPTEWDSFKAMIRKTGNMIIGRRTYDLMKESGELDGLTGIAIVVLSRKAVKKPLGKTAINFAKTPAECLEILAANGFKNALLAGGGQAFSAFLHEGLVDEVYLDVEPALVGTGIPLIAPGDIKANLKLLGTKRLSKNEIQLHYSVVR